MPDAAPPEPPTISAEARSLLLRVAAADGRASHALHAAITELAIAEEMRLEDRARVALAALLRASITAVAGELREHAARVLGSRGLHDAAATLSAVPMEDVEDLASHLLRGDVAVIDECLARVRLELLAASLPVEAPADAGTPSLLAQLTRGPDRVVASAAADVLAGESARRHTEARWGGPDCAFPATLQRKLVWSVAAALIHATVEPSGGGAHDRAIAGAARRSLAAHDDQYRLESVALRLAHAIDARADELPLLLEDCFRDRQLTLAVAFVAHALALSFEAVRGLFVDAADDRLWLALHAIGLPRPAIARIAFLLSEADARRDIDAIADTLDVALSLDATAARGAIASLGLETDYRAALLALRTWRP